MIYIALNVFFNAFILSIIIVMGTDIMRLPPIVGCGIAYAIAGGLTLIGYTRFGNNVVGLFMPGRQMIGREKAKLEPLLADVIEKTNNSYKTNYRLSDFKIRVTDNKVVNACALGYNTITVNRGAFEAFTDEQLRAILAHEMGHLYYRDSVKNIALIFGSFGTRIVMTIYGIYLMFARALSQSVRGQIGPVIVFASIMPLLLFLPVVILNWVGSKVFNLLSLMMSRGAEYRADNFVVSIGYKADMIAALEVMERVTVYDNSFIAKLMATHPSPMLRVGALEDKDAANNRLFSVNPLLTYNAKNNTNEVIKLSTVLVIGGLLWGVMMLAFHSPKQLQLSQQHKIAPLDLTDANRMVHIMKVQKITPREYVITYKIDGEKNTNTLRKHAAPSKKDVTLQQLKEMQ